MKQNKISAFVREKRKEIGLSQPAMAREIGVGVRFYKELEMGKESLKMDIVNKVIRYFGAELIPNKIDIENTNTEGKSLKIKEISDKVTDIQLQHDSHWINAGFTILRKLINQMSINSKVPFFDGSEYFYEINTQNQETENVRFYVSDDCYERYIILSSENVNNKGLKDIWKKVILRYILGIHNLILINRQKGEKIILTPKEIFDNTPLAINGKYHSIKRQDIIEAIKKTGLPETEAEEIIENIIKHEDIILKTIDTTKINNDTKSKIRMYARTRLISIKVQL